MWLTRLCSHRGHVFRIRLSQMSPLVAISTAFLKLNTAEIKMAVPLGNAILIFLILLVLKVFFLRKPNHVKSLCGKHVVITGASSGIGFALAKKCLSEGAFVTLLARNEANLVAASTKLIKIVGCHSDQILLKAVDVTDASAISLAIKETFRWRPIDILICNAGAATLGLFDAVNVENLDLVTRTNLLGSVYPVHAVLPLMKTRSLKNPSSIVFMSSLSGLLLMPAASMYTPTKYALKGLAESLRIELIPHNIRVNLICPGFTKTPMLDLEYKISDVALDAPWFPKFMVDLLYYNREYAESPDEVATKTMEGVKRGDFLITTSIRGFFVGVISRGFVPAESVSVALIEMILIVPMRIVSFLWSSCMRKLLEEQLNKNLDMLRYPTEKPYVHS